MKKSCPVICEFFSVVNDLIYIIEVKHENGNGDICCAYM